MVWFFGVSGVVFVASYVYLNWDWYKNSVRFDLVYLKVIKFKILDGSGR